LKFDNDEGTKGCAFINGSAEDRILMNEFLLSVAQAVYWHSSAHILGEALERIYGGCLCYGPPIENGFYYDIFTENHVSSWYSCEKFHIYRTILYSLYSLSQPSTHDFPVIEDLVKGILKEKQPFERLEVKKETLLEMFKVRIKQTA
jgi:threonyl-tRNA synthetase